MIFEGNKYEFQLQLKEINETMYELNRKLDLLGILIDNIYCKAGISNALLVVRKISEDKVEELKKLLD